MELASARMCLRLLCEKGNLGGRRGSRKTRWETVARVQARKDKGSEEAGAVALETGEGGLAAGAAMGRQGDFNATR